MTRTAASGQPERRDPQAAQFHFRLFVAGDEPNSALAKAALRDICSNHLEGECRVETVDVLEDFQPALEDNILVTPALIIEKPEPRTIIFGNLTDKQKVLAALQVTEEL
jgi:circadian clock protein KaiB